MVSVDTILSYTVFAWFMLAMVVRRIILLTFAAINGRYRPTLDLTQVPEDNIMKPKDLRTPIQEIGSVVYNKELRTNRVIGDDTENDIYFLILLLATAIVSDNVSDPCTRTIVYGVIYLIARTMFTLCYILALQPWRTMFSIITHACTLACSIDLVITMSTKPN